jgi:hypothetical protein
MLAAFYAARWPRSVSGPQTRDSITCRAMKRWPGSSNGAPDRHSFCSFLAPERNNVVRLPASRVVCSHCRMARPLRAASRIDDLGPGHTSVSPGTASLVPPATHARTRSMLHHPDLPQEPIQKMSLISRRPGASAAASPADAHAGRRLCCRRDPPPRSAGWAAANDLHLLDRGVNAIHEFSA